MSDAKTPKKVETVSKKNDTIKTEVSTNDTKSVESSASKSVSAPKSAAQSSISHFSSVSTPQYRSGWNSIFGDGNDTKKVVPIEVNENDLPKKLNIRDYDIDLPLRDALDAAFNNFAQKRGINLGDATEILRFEYDLSCEIKTN